MVRVTLFVLPSGHIILAQTLLESPDGRITRYKVGKKSNTIKSGRERGLFFEKTKVLFLEKLREVIPKKKYHIKIPYTYFWGLFLNLFFNYVYVLVCVSNFWY